MKGRESRVLNKVKNREVISCFKVNLTSPNVSEIAALANFDCIWIDQEHIGQDWSQIAAHIWAAKAHNTDIMVRVSRGSYSDYIKPLEMDAAGIMVPHIMNLADAKKVVETVRFFPVGKRPIDGGNADGLYTKLDFKEYLKIANSRRFLAIQIEDPEPLNDLEEIAALDGIDMLFFGPADFSQGIGSPGQWDHPKLIETRIKVAEVARKNGKIAATVGSLSNKDELIAMGYNFISIGADVVGLTEYCGKIADSFNQGESDFKSDSYLNKSI